jgi:hypothetical protein
MPHRVPARTATRRTRVRRARLAGLLVIAAIAVGLGYQLLASGSSTASRSPSAAAPLDVPRSDPGAPPDEPDHPVTDRATARERRGALGEAGGAVPDGTTAFDDDVPGVANLAPALLRALRQAARAAANDGIELVVDSGWRSPAYQERLLHEAVAEYGSQEEAARWVATPETSAHVSGDAVDVGPPAAAAWLSAHGAGYGLCQIYGNEPWHYELRPDAVDEGCPPMYADPTHDPRMR